MDRKTLALTATIIGSGMVVLDGFIVNLALPAISHGLHASFSDLQWIVDGYLLFLSALILVGGSLGDIFGRKKVYLIGLLGFSIGSLLCGLAPNTTALIAFRIVQGIFGALLVPGGLAIINTNFPKQERGRAIGRWSAWLAIVTPIGPLLGGYIITVSSWRWIFFINIPLALVCGYLGIKNIQESRDMTKRKIDIKGALTATFGLAGLTYGLIEGPVTKWHLQSLAPLIGGAILMVIFLWLESKEKDPMIHLSLFRSRNFSGSNLMTFGMYGALAGFMFSILIYLQTKMGYSALVAGMSLLPISISLLLLSSRMGALSAKYGPRFFITLGPLLVALSMFLLSSYQPGDSYLTFLLPRVILFGLGMALFVAPLTITVMASVSETSSGIASGINNAVSRVAGLVVIAVLGLFGTNHVYRFTTLLCAGLATVAGVAAYLLIQNKPKPIKVEE
jgi:EmrB/QacA subfamily drug resistance transporter